jgi:hypothetical protein
MPGGGWQRVTFDRGYVACIIAIDGTWRRQCQLKSISEMSATLTVEASLQGLNVKEFFLLLSSTGLAYRRCELSRVNGPILEVNFLMASKSRRVNVPKHTSSSTKSV